MALPDITLLTLFPLVRGQAHHAECRECRLLSTAECPGAGAGPTRFMVNK